MTHSITNIRPEVTKEVAKRLSLNPDLKHLRGFTLHDQKSDHSVIQKIRKPTIDTVSTQELQTSNLQSVLATGK